MLIDRFVRFLLPRQGKFFELLDQLGGKLQEASDKFGGLAGAHSPADFAEISRQVRVVEHDADEIAHQIYEALDSTFVTPIDREDLAALTKSIDDVVDHLEHCAAFVVHYRLNDLTPVMRELHRILGLAVKQVVGAVGMIRHYAQPDKLHPFVVEANSLENEADIVYRKGLEQLFESDINAKDLIRQKDIIQVLEDSIDACEDVLDVIRSVVVKNG